MYDTNSELTNTTNALALNQNAYTASQVSTLQIVDNDTRKLVMNAANNAQSLARQGSKVLDVIGIIMRPGIMRGRNGQHDMPCTDTTLVCADGSAYLTKSEGIRKAADNLIMSGVFDNGEIVPMHVNSYETDNGNTIKTLVLD